MSTDSTAAPARYGSDLIAETLRDLGIDYIALNPGSSFRGLHDSLVNHLGATGPHMLTCLHEEHAVAIAHGYAKVTGRAMAVAVHANVGLMHASMAVFNAWCDRMPVLLLGGTGNLDAAKRRPWIEWIHTAIDQGALVRNFTKWDDLPGSPQAARVSVARAQWLAELAPQAPTYVNLDVDVQERVCPPEAFQVPLPHLPQTHIEPSAAAVAQVAQQLRAAHHPVILMGRVGRSTRAWAQRVRLAEHLGARVLTDLKIGGAFPTEHPLHAGAPGIYADDAALEAVRAADVLLSLDWVDLAGLQAAACPDGRPAATVVQVSVDHVLHRGWSMDYQDVPVADTHIQAEADAFVAALCAALQLLADEPPVPDTPLAAPPALPPTPAGAPLGMGELAWALREAMQGRAVTITRLPLGWNGADWPLHHPLDFIGSEGGGGVGAGPGIAVGAALALRDTPRVPLAICGDGDYLMGITALWTAVHERLPLICVVANNQSFFNDEVHQERVARARGRDPRKTWVGQRLADPALDLCELARAQGAVAHGPARNRAELLQACRAALADFDRGHVVVVDAHIAPGYTPAMMSGLVQSENS